MGTLRQRDGKEIKVKVAGRGSAAYGGRIFVLIDEQTASAAEIFAAGIQSSGRGIIVGRNSTGMVLAARNYSLPDGFKVQIPILDYLTANGIRLEGVGVKPDQPVAITAQDLRDNRDPDIERVRVLAGFP